VPSDKAIRVTVRNTGETMKRRSSEIQGREAAGDGEVGTRLFLTGKRVGTVRETELEVARQMGEA
jgi:hypothetical protein